MTILLTGGSGCLGSELRRLDETLLCPDETELDVRDAEQVLAYVRKWSPTLVIHAAAMTNNRGIEHDPRSALEVNIKGSVNVALACLERRTRLVYLSTDYVYSGDSGGYDERDPVQPFNLYAWTKLAGEAAVRAVPNHLILRLSFGPRTLDYAYAFTDKWASKEYVDLLAPEILEAALSPLTGVLHLGSPRRSLYDFAKLRNPDVLPLPREQAEHDSPADTSLRTQRWTNYRQGRAELRAHQACRCCGQSALRPYLDLGMMPLANNLASSAIEAKRMQRYPLQVMFCESCGLSQLSVVVDPELLFSHYTYRSSVNKGYLRHCRAMARHLSERLGLKGTREAQPTQADLVVDIAGNDGALLHEFRDELGVRVLNVDPAQNLALIAREKGIPTLASFWSMAVAEQLLAEFGQPRLITATNVFAHVDDMRGFLAAVHHCLRRDGALVLEFPYLGEFLEHREFDTVYFEHLSYVSLLPLMASCQSVGLEVFDVEAQDIHGGTLRVFVGHQGAWPTAPAVAALVAEERGRKLDAFDTYAAWARDIDALVLDLSTQLETLKRKGARIAAFGASAKGNTLLNVCGIHRGTIEYIVDDTPEKIGKFSPGTGIPIVSRAQLQTSPPDYLLILAWNFAKEIIESNPDFTRRGGQWIVPIPAFCIVSVNPD